MTEKHESSNTKHKVLFIEDEPNWHKTIHRMLRGSSFDIEHADCLDVGLKRIAEGGIDVVLLDLGLPDSRELDTLRRVNAQAPGMPIVVLTGLEDETIGTTAVQEGAQDYLPKTGLEVNLLVRALRYAIERKLAEEALRESERIKSELIAISSHELRTPLTSIKNAIHIILGETAGPINENQRKFLSIADRNINRLSDIIEDLLDISKMELRRMRIDLKSLELGAPLDMAIASLTSRAREKSISIHKEIPSDLPQAYGDSDKLEQIFISLLDNAIKFTPEGGQIYVSAKDYEPGRGFIEISVADTGVGIPAYELEKIFGRFYQVTESLTREIQGAGLGLSIVKGLVETHGGKIWAESVVGKGSKFTFTLPQYSPQRVFSELRTII